MVPELEFVLRVESHPSLRKHKGLDMLFLTLQTLGAPKSARQGTLSDLTDCEIKGSSGSADGDTSTTDNSWLSIQLIGIFNVPLWKLS